MAFGKESAANDSGDILASVGQLVSSLASVELYVQNGYDGDWPAQVFASAVFKLILCIRNVTVGQTDITALVTITTVHAWNGTN